MQVRCGRVGMVLTTAAVGSIHCCSVICSYLYLCGDLGKLTYVLIMFGCCTFLVTTGLILIVAVWKLTESQSSKIKYPSRRTSVLRKISRFPFGSSARWTISSNPVYVRAPNRPLPPVPEREAPVLTFCDQEEDIYGSSSSEDHTYAELETFV